MTDAPWSLIEIARWIAAALVMLALPVWAGLALIAEARRAAEAGAKSPLETFVHIRSARRRRK